MDLEIDQFVCRTCLSKKENMKSIFNIADILMTCAPIQIEQGDGLPTLICSECVNHVTQANEFRLLCEQSDNILRKKLIKHIVLIKSDRSDLDFADISRDDSCSPDLNTEVPLDISPEEQKTKKTRQKRNTKKGNENKEKSPIFKKEEDVDLQTNLNQISDESETELNKNDTELSCRYCDMKFRYKVRLKKHEQKHLHGLKCHLCEKDFSTIKQLTNHINIHSRKGSHLCQTCGKQFTLPENLMRHQRIHSGIRPYKCQFCSKSFTQSNELKSHLVTHSSEKHHLCSVCGNKYSRSISLRVHMRRIHSIPPNHRPYICAVCGRNFKDRRDLSQHMQIHTGERSHVCKVCGKAFNRSSNLRVHERIHSGHKPHVCPVCQRAFIQKHVLNTHLRTHPHVPPLGRSAAEGETESGSVIAE